MVTSIRALAAVAVLTWSAIAALAQDKLRIRIIVSGPLAVLGGQVRDGFSLAVKTLGGKLGGGLS